MKHHLLLFALFAILLAGLYHLGLGLLYAHYFSASRGWQDNWILPFLVVPALLLTGLAWRMGFFRRSSTRWGDAVVLAIIAGIVYLTLDASYSCGTGCF